MKLALVAMVTALSATPLNGSASPRPGSEGLAGSTHFDVPGLPHRSPNTVQVIAWRPFWQRPQDYSIPVAFAALTTQRPTHFTCESMSASSSSVKVRLASAATESRI